MTNDIKEILEDLKNNDISVDDLTHNDKVKLLDYITNLQQRIDKAIEYIDSDEFWFSQRIAEEELLEILRGED